MFTGIFALGVLVMFLVTDLPQGSDSCFNGATLDFGKKAAHN